MDKYIVGLFKDEEILMDAVKEVRTAGVIIDDVQTPFPVHGLDEVMGLKESNLHTAGFYGGLTGAAIAFGFMTWVNTSSYPLNIGGKPFFSVPSFIPITFELTILLASFAIFFGFLIRCGLYPGKQPKIFDKRITDDMFAMIFKVNENTTTEEEAKIRNLLTDNGVAEINVIDFDEEDE
ncbi:MAG: DUF3341 domain-containing protein [Chitinophagaceae bacterium]|nr:MAG: DUF3341 domain-containing protein [Chitinophagaceae bacterium]